jgi:hypothetical protein
MILSGFSTGPLGLLDSGTIFVFFIVRIPLNYEIKNFKTGLTETIIFNLDERRKRNFISVNILDVTHLTRAWKLSKNGQSASHLTPSNISSTLCSRIKHFLLMSDMLYSYSQKQRQSIQIWSISITSLSNCTRRKDIVADSRVNHKVRRLFPFSDALRIKIPCITVSCRICRIVPTESKKPFRMNL